jgi:hypothetical protein
MPTYVVVPAEFVLGVAHDQQRLTAKIRRKVFTRPGYLLVTTDNLPTAMEDVSRF